MNEGKIVGTITPTSSKIKGKPSPNRGSIGGEVSVPKVIMEDDYDLLENKPQIEGTELIGNKTFEELNLIGITNSELENLIRV